MVVAGRRSPFTSSLEVRTKGRDSRSAGLEFAPCVTSSSFLSVSGLALSVAGFAGLVSAFRGRDQGWTRAELWRLRMIARLSFILVFLALLPFPLYALTGDEPLVIRIVSTLIILAHLFGMLELALLARLVHPINLFLLVLRSFEPPVIDA